MREFEYFFSMYSQRDVSASHSSIPALLEMVKCFVPYSRGTVRSSVVLLALEIKFYFQNLSFEVTGSKQILHLARMHKYE